MAEHSSIKDVSSVVSNWHWSSESYRDAAEWLLAEILPKAPGSHGGEQIWRTSLKEVFVYRLPETLGGFRVAVKTCHEHRFWRYFLRPSLTCREAIGFEIVKGLGMPAVDVLLCGEDRNPFCLKRSYFASRFEEDTAQLLDFAPGRRSEAMHDDLMTLLRENVALLAKMHQAGYRHGGAHPRNFLWKRQPDGTPRLIWIDLATVGACLPTDRKHISLDLSDLIEYFDLNDEELKELCDIYRNVHDLPIAFRRTGRPQGKLNECVFKA